MEYTIVVGDNISELKKMVNAFLCLKNGWKPEGSPSYDLRLGIYMQAIVRELKDGAQEN